MRTALLTFLALTAFAANSVLCRLALGAGAIDAASFASVRLVSGTAALLLVMLARRTRPVGSWPSALALLLYAVPFSLAYVSLSAGTGALILFGAVQATMIGVGLREGDRPHRWEWLGLGMALAGLVYLVSPGLSAPSFAGSSLMAVAGIAWGVYSLHGRGGARPAAATAGNFLRATPLALLVSIVSQRHAHVSPRGVLLAVLSGAVTSGMGYVIWYAALRGLTATRAAMAQLSVPALTAIAGVLLLREPITVRLVFSAILILGGVVLALRARASPAPAASPAAAEQA
jgi:drug/metabolite transporter (DMT)-like permease